VLFFGNVFSGIGHKYFAINGDGLQNYYNAIYHIKYDSTYSHTQVMNYPYGEHVMFTGNHPLVANSLRFITIHFFDVSNWVVPVINLLMLLSIILGAIFIFLIFKELEVKDYYAILVSVGIVFLSPQLQRFLGHYTLSYLFIIPGIIYFLLRFYKNPSYKWSFGIAFFILILSLFHLYNYAFCAFISLGFWFFLIVNNKKYRNWKFASSHVILQIISPYLLITIWLWLTDNIGDRTHNPWGFIALKSGWEGIFNLIPKINILKDHISIRSIPWEGYAPIGMIASIVFFFIFNYFSAIPFISPNNLALLAIIIVIGFIIRKSLKNSRKIWQLTDNVLLNYFIWIGLAGLIVSFGFPFALSPELLNWMGAVKQLRAVGRFAWIFFYIINIAAFYYLWRLQINKYLKSVILILAVLILYYEAYNNVRSIPQQMNNQIALLDDTENQLPENQWLNSLNSSDYQALISLPYYHIGCENYWREVQCNALYYNFIFAVKTGLPSTSTILSRTSISQTFNILQLFLEHYKTPSIIKDFPSRKPFLLLVMNCESFLEGEKNLISKAKLLEKQNDFSIYILPFSAIEQIGSNLFEEETSKMNSSRLFDHNSFKTTDSINSISVNSFDDLKTSEAYQGEGAYRGKLKSYNTIFYDNIPNYNPNREYIISFWINGIYSDLYARTSIQIACFDTEEKEYKSDYTDVFRNLKTLDNNWALVEIPFKLNSSTDKIKVLLRNSDASKNQNIIIDQLMIRPNDCVVYQYNNEVLNVNNRYYKNINQFHDK